MFKVTAYWKSVIVCNNTRQSIFEINRQYYIRMSENHSMSMVEGHLNFDRVFYQTCLPKYTKERIAEDGDIYGVLATINSQKPTWREEPPKCQCGVWLVGGIHEDWCQRKKYEENT